jgi:hypothetical protein
MTCRSPSSVLIEFGSNAKLTATRRSEPERSSVTYIPALPSYGSEPPRPDQRASGAGREVAEVGQLEDRAERSPDSNPPATSGAVLDVIVTFTVAVAHQAPSTSQTG